MKEVLTPGAGSLRKMGAAWLWRMLSDIVEVWLLLDMVVVWMVLDMEVDWLMLDMVDGRRGGRLYTFGLMIY